MILEKKYYGNLVKLACKEFAKIRGIGQRSEYASVLKANKV